MGHYPQMHGFELTPREFRVSDFGKLFSFNQPEILIRLWSPKINERSIRDDGITTCVWIRDMNEHASEPNYGYN